LKKAFIVIASVISILVVSSCASTHDKIEPIRIEVVYFDKQTAKQMIEKGDKIISDIAVKDKISRKEYIQFLSKIADAYNGYKDEKWEYMFFYNNEFEDNKIDTLHLNKNVFYPTIYHQDIEVVSAKITNTYYKEKFLNNSLLTIREEYLGGDVKFKDWYREYNYKKDDKGSWVFRNFGGQMNFMGENFTSNYLKLK
jgi:hypothetical protein